MDLVDLSRPAAATTSLGKLALPASWRECFRVPGGSASAARVAAPVRLDSAHDGGVVPLEEPADIAVAVVTLRMLDHEVPQLVPGPRNRARLAATAQLLAGDAAAHAHVVDEVEQTADLQVGDDALCRWAHDRPA